MGAPMGMFFALLVLTAFALPVAAIPKHHHQVQQLRGQMSHSKVRLALLAARASTRWAAGENSTAAEAADRADGTDSAEAEAVVAEAERAAAKEEAKYQNSDSSSTVASSDEAVGNVDSPTQKQAANKTGAMPQASGKRSGHASQWQKGAQAHTRPRLHVEIVGARGLKGSVAGGVNVLGITDPYCVCEVVNKPRSRFQTLAIDGLNGVHWNHPGSLEEFAASDSLRFSVYDHDALKRQSLLGVADMAVWRIVKGGFRGEIPLPGAGQDGDSAYLKLVIKREGSGWDSAAWERATAEAREAAKEMQEDREATEDAEDAEDDEESDDAGDAKDAAVPAAKAHTQEQAAAGTARQTPKAAVAKH